MSSVTARSLPLALAGVAVIAAVVVGCSETISGTPQADPAQTGVPLEPSTTTSRPSRTSGPAPSTTVPTRTTTPGGTAPAGDTTTCAAYTGMDAAAKLAIMKVIGRENVMIQQDPGTWVTVADMLCSIADPTALVKDVVVGKM